MNEKYIREKLEIRIEGRFYTASRKTVILHIDVYVNIYTIYKREKNTCEYF